MSESETQSTGTPVFADERGPEGYEPGDLVDVIQPRAFGEYVERATTIESETLT